VGAADVIQCSAFGGKTIHTRGCLSFLHSFIQMNHLHVLGAIWSILLVLVLKFTCCENVCSFIFLVGVAALAVFILAVPINLSLVLGEF